MSLQNSISDMFQGMRFFIPEILILVWVLVLVGFEIFIARMQEKIQFSLRFFIGYLGLIFGMIFAFQRGGMNYFGPVGAHLFFLDGHYNSFAFLILILGFLLLFTTHFIKEKIYFEEMMAFWAIIMGALYTGASAHWLTALLSIETMTLGTYGLISFNKTRISYRAGLPYLFLGLTVTAVFIYGISLIYGISGTLEFMGNEFSRGIAMNESLGIIGLAMVSIALLFKMAIAPMHPWVPEVIESLPAQWMVLLSTIPKLAIAFLGLRILKELPIAHGEIVAILCLITLLIGNFGALRQKNTKRLLAYSSIAHGGFMAMIWINPSAEAYSLVLFYGLIYFLGSLITFFLLDRDQAEYRAKDLQDYAGLGLENTVFGILVIIGIIGLIGFPPAPSLWVKIGYFGFIWDYFNETQNIIYLVLFITSLILTVISLFYYLKIPFQLFLKKGDGKFNYLIVKGKNQVFLGILCILFLLLFFFPNF